MFKYKGEPSMPKSKGETTMSNYKGETTMSNYKGETTMSNYKGETTMYRTISSCWKIGIILFTFLVIGVLPAQATFTWGGSVTPDPTGAPDPWDIGTDTLIVGDVNDGWLTISNGETLITDVNALIARPTVNTGDDGDVDGTLTVTGDGSTLTVGQQLIIGAMVGMDPNGWDANGYLDILDGGLVDVTGDVILAYDANTADTKYSYADVLIKDADSLLDVGGHLYVSHGEGSNSDWEIDQGGAVNVGGNLYMGYGVDSDYDADTIRSPDSFTIGGDMYLSFGEDSDGDFDIENSGVVDVTGNAYIGYGDNSYAYFLLYDYYEPNGTIQIDGDSTHLDVGGDLYAACGEDSDAELIIDDSGAVNVQGNAYLAYGLESEVEIDFDDINNTDAYSPSLNVGGNLYMGWGENSEFDMDIDDGAVVDVNGDAYLAYGENSVGYLDVYDPCSRLDLTGSDLYVAGGNGSYAEVEIYNEGVVDVNGDAYLAYGENSEGYLDVYDPNSRLDLTGSDLYVAVGNGSYAEVEIYNEGVVDVNGDAHFGSGDGRVWISDDQPDYNDYSYEETDVYLDIYDPNSSLNVGGDLYIADGNGADAHVDIYNGGVADVAGDVRIGGDRDYYTSRDYTLCSGNSDWSSSDDSDVWIDIEDANSRLDVGNNLYAGDGYDSWVDIDIRDGGVLDVVGDAYIGYGDDSYAFVDVQDFLSQFNWGGRLYLGYGDDYSYGRLDTHYSDANSAVDVNVVLGHGEGSGGELYIEDVNYQDLNLLDNFASFSMADGNDSYAYMYIHNVGDINVTGDLILARGDWSSAELYIENDIYDANHPAPQINLNGGNLYLGYGEDSAAGTFDWDYYCGAEPYNFYHGLELHDGMSTANVNDVYVGFGVDSSGLLYEADPNSQLNYDGMLYVGYGGWGAVGLNYANLGAPKDMNVILGYGEGSWGALYIEDANWQDFTFSSNADGDFILGNGEDSRALLDITDVNKFTVARDLVMALGDGSRAMIDFNDSCPYDERATNIDVGRNMYLGFGDGSQVGCIDGYWDFCGGSVPELDYPLEIHDHMTVDVNNNLYLGFGPGSVGYMTVDESSRLNYGGTLYLGVDGIGLLEIDYGWLDSPMDMNVILGQGEDSIGGLLIEDANGQDFTFRSNADGDFILGNGDDSMGFLAIGDVNSITVGRDLIFANGDGSRAMMWIDGPNTLLDVDGSLYLGHGDYSYAGCADNICTPWWYWDPLEIHDGMVLDVNEDIYLGFGVDSNGVMTVDSTSELTYGGTLYVGYDGTGLLRIDYGNALDPKNMNAILGYGPDSRGRLIIEDANTLNLSSSPDFFVAYGDDSEALLEIDDVNNVNVDGTLYAAYGDYSSVIGCGDPYDCFEDPGLTIDDFNTIDIGDDLILAYGDESDAWMSLWSDDFNSPRMDVGGTMYLGYGEDSRAGLYIGDGIYVDVNQDVYVDYGPGCTSPCSEADGYTACYDWDLLCCDDNFSVSVLMVEPNATLDVGGNLWVGYGTYSVGGVELEEAALNVNDDIILGFQPHSYGLLGVYDSDLTFGRMFVGYGGHGTLEIEDVNTVDLNEGVVFFGFGPDSSANLDIWDVNRVNVTGSWNLGYGQDSVAMVGLDHVNDVNVTGNLNLAYGEDSWGSMSLSHVNDVNIAGDLNLAYGQDSYVPKVCLIDVNNMQVGGNLSLAHGSSSTFGTLSVLDSTVYIGDSLYMGYGGTADELIINRSFIGVGTDPCALDEGLSIASDGYLGGGGTIWGDVYNQGTIAPGNSIGTLRIVGDLTFEPNSVYAVDIANSDNSSDKVEVTGDLTLNGGTIEVKPVETITQRREYTIAEAGSVINSDTDGWDSNDVDVVAPSVLLDVEDPNLMVGTTDVRLAVNAIGFDEPNIIKTDSQSELGDALQQIANEEGGNVVTTGLQQITSKSSLLKAYNQLSNQSRPPVDPITIDASMRFLGVVGEHLRGFRPIAGRSSYRQGPLFAMNGPVSQITGTTMMDINPYGAVAVGNGSPLLSDSRWGVWAKGYGVFGDRESDSGITGHDYRISGLGFGLDYMFTDALLAGVTLGYSDGDVDYDDLRDSTDVQSTHIGAYASYKQDSWYVDAIFSYGQNEYDSVRYVDFLSERLTGSYDGQSFSGYLEVGMDWRETEISLLQPLVGLQIGRVSIDSYRESGGDSAVGVGQSDYDSIKSSLGLKYTHMFTTMGGRFDGSARLHARWLHEFGDDNSSVDAYFTSNPDAVFTIQDAEVSRDSALLGGRLSIDIGEQARAAIQYDVSLNNIETTQFIGGFLLYRW